MSFLSILIKKDSSYKCIFSIKSQSDMDLDYFNKITSFFWDKYFKIIDFESCFAPFDTTKKYIDYKLII